MEEIKRQVGRAQRRLVLQQFFTVFGWSLFATLLVATIGLAIPRLAVVDVPQQTWDWSWIGGGLAAGLAVAAIWTYIIRRSRLDAAIEIDRRFGLKERVSSTLALTNEELTTEIGQALMTDAVRRVERIDVREQFQVAPTWRFLLPLAPVIAIVVLTLLPNAVAKKAEAASTQAAGVERKQVKIATEKLVEKLRDSQKKAEEQGLKDNDLLKEINKELNKLANKETTDRKEALLKINDLAKEIEKRKQELGGAEKMKQQLDKLKDVEKGPADKLAEALKDGDFGKAKEQMEKLKEDMKAGKLGKEDQEKVAKQMEQMKEKLQQAMQDKKEAQQKLQEQIEQKLAEGKAGEAAKLQQQLDAMQQNAQQQEQMMQQLADKLGQAAQAMKQGDQQQAMEQLDKLAQEMKGLQEQLDQIENLDEILDQLADAKEAMKCQNCQGQGCAECEGNGKGEGQGKGKGKNKGDKAGKGLGEGKGEGDRPEEQTDKKFYDTRVAADPKAGESVRIGDAGGPNKAGKTLEAVKQEIQAALAKEPDALEDVTLPRDQRENAKQYFDKIRKGE